MINWRNKAMEACELRLIAVESSSPSLFLSLSLFVSWHVRTYVSGLVCVCVRVWMERTLVVLPLLRQEQSDFQG